MRPGKPAIDLPVWDDDDAVMKREVLAEILDELPDHDPRAVRSRRDLRMINRLMGNERWIRRVVQKHAHLDWHLSELGAGKGELLGSLAESGRGCTGYDLVPQPDGLADQIEWEQGDFFQSLAANESEVVVGSLILHHFQEDALAELGRLLAKRRLLVFAEPLRSRLALAEGYALFPLVNDVTRHDMMVSIRAGFRRDELAAKLDLLKGWTWRECVTARGGLRSFAVRTGAAANNG